MKAIVNVDRNWGIGNKGELLVHIPADMKMFRNETTGKVVICGRKTLATFPGGKPLKNRVNIILTRNPNFSADGAEIAHDVQEMKKLIAPYDTDDVYVIGGDSIYQLLLPMCDEVIVTKTEAAFESDAHFHNLDEDPAWECVERGDTETYENLNYHFDRYRRK